MSVIKTGTTSTTGYIVESDTNGNLVIQTGSTPTTALTLNSNQTATFAQSVNTPNTFGFKNRIINPGMVIDQRNNGASVTPSVGAYVYTLDRWSAYRSNSAGAFSVQQSSTAPAGFSNSVQITITTASTPSAGHEYGFRQAIEGFNFSDFNWGTASAQPATISFWIRSSLTGTFSGAVFSNASADFYPFTFTISAANTWEYKTVTVPGRTSGTFSGGNGNALNLWFTIGIGTTYAPNAWNTSGIGATGAVNLIATNGATMNITGVQLEKGSTATSFDFRPYGTELALCQRYYFRNTNNGITFAGFGIGRAYSTTEGTAAVYMPVPMRASPTIGRSPFTGNNWDYSISAINIQAATSSNQLINCFCAGSFTNGGAFNLSSGNTTSTVFIDFSAEL